MTYSIYGGTGFVGGNFCRLFSDNVILQNRDERKPNTKEIIYFISTVDNYNVHTNITLDVETNLKVLCEVLDFCRDTNTVFNFVSSWFVYGETELPAKEEYYCKPTGFYSITKKAAEDLLISFCRTYGVKYRILRLCNVMGNGDGKVSAKKNALSYMIDLLKKNDAPEIIDYLSIDTEGSELDILKQFFSENTKYKIRCITVEHNNHIIQRFKIKELLEEQGYTRKYMELSRWDDYFYKDVL